MKPETKLMLFTVAVAVAGVFAAVPAQADGPAAQCGADRSVAAHAGTSDDAGAEPGDRTPSARP